jgi:hypothetical protein
MKMILFIIIIYLAVGEPAIYNEFSQILTRKMSLTEAEWGQCIFCGLFHNTVRIYSPQHPMQDDWWIGKDLEGSGRGLLGHTPEFA